MKHTATMTPEQLARTWAAHHGLKGHKGGWFYDPTGRPIVQGWRDLTELLERQGAILPGRGVDWAAGITPEALATLRAAGMAGWRWTA